jgi:hypothetical protein
MLKLPMIFIHVHVSHTSYSSLSPTILPLALLDRLPAIIYFFIYVPKYENLYFYAHSLAIIHYELG